MDNTNKPRNGRRKPPKDMPSQVETIKRSYLKETKRDVLPKQKALTEEPEPKPPAKWKAVAKKILFVIGILLALAFLYLFLLMGEPDDDDEFLMSTNNEEEIIQLPMTGQEMTGGSVDISAAAVSFGESILQLRGELLTLQKATLYDTAYQGGYARRLTLTYAFSDGSVLTIDSIRPKGAMILLEDSDYTIRVDEVYSMGGFDAVRMDSDDYIRIVAEGEDVTYFVHLPVSHEEELSTLLQYTGLVSSDGE